MRKRILTLGLIVTLVCSSFVGLAMALRTVPADPLTQILQTVLGINTKTDNLANTTQVLASYHNSISVSGVDNVKGIEIQASKPVIFMVTVSSANVGDEEAVNVFRGFDNAFLIVAQPVNTVVTVTFTAEKMILNGVSFFDTVIFDYDIIIQGTQGTAITVFDIPLS